MQLRCLQRITEYKTKVVWMVKMSPARIILWPRRVSFVWLQMRLTSVKSSLSCHKLDLRSNLEFESFRDMAHPSITDTGSIQSLIIRELQIFWRKFVLFCSNFSPLLENFPKKKMSTSTKTCAVENFLRISTKLETYVGKYKLFVSKQNDPA